MANFVADTAISELFLYATHNVSDIPVLEEVRRGRMVKKEVAKVLGNSMTEKLLLKWVRDRLSERSSLASMLKELQTISSKDNGKVKDEANKACAHFFITVENVCSLLERVQDEAASQACQKPRTDNVQTSKWLLFRELYELTKQAYKTFSATEDLMRIYIWEMWSSRAQVAIQCIAFTASCHAVAQKQLGWMSRWAVPTYTSFLGLAWTMRKAYTAQEKKDYCEQSWSSNELLDCSITNCGPRSCAFGLAGLENSSRD